MHPLIARRGGPQRHEELIEGPAGHHDPIKTALPQASPLPLHHGAVTRGRTGPPHLKERGEDKKCQHRHDREACQSRLLIAAEDVKRACHVVAWEENSAVPSGERLENGKTSAT